MASRTYLAACIFFIGLSQALAATTAADCNSELLEVARVANRTVAPVLTITERSEGASRDNQSCEPVSDTIEKYTLKPVQGIYRVPDGLRSFSEKN